MKILLITEWFPPVKGAAAKRTQMMAKNLRRQGYKITVLTSFPSYPTGILPQKYYWKIWDRTIENGLDILRVWEFPTANTGTFKRILREFTFFITSTMAALILPVYDAVIVSSPSFLSGLAGLAARREKCRFYFDVRDLWPDSLVGLNVIKPGFLLKILEKLEAFYYQRATKVLVATPGIRKHLFLEGIPLNKIEVLLNGADTHIFKPQKINRPADFKPDDLIVTFTGNHSRMYDLENVLKTAVILEKQPRIKFLFVGEGEIKTGLKETVQKLKLANVIFYDEKTLQEVAEILAWSDVGLISLNPSKLAQESLPSKLAEYLSSGLPVAAAIGQDAKKIIEDNKVGLIYQAGEPKSLAEVILKLYRNKSLRQKMGRNARKLALKTFSQKSFAKKLSQIFPIS